jgi:hypothetical protein
MDIKTESELENITNLSWVECTMYENAKSIAFATTVKIDALSGNLTLDVKLFPNTATSTCNLLLKRPYKYV